MPSSRQHTETASINSQHPWMPLVDLHKNWLYQLPVMNWGSAAQGALLFSNELLAIDLVRGRVIAFSCLPTKDPFSFQWKVPIQWSHNWPLLN